VEQTKKEIMEQGKFLGESFNRKEIRETECCMGKALLQYNPYPDSLILTRPGKEISMGVVTCMYIPFVWNFL